MHIEIESFSIFENGYNTRYFIDKCLTGFGFIQKNGLHNGSYELMPVSNVTENRDFFYNRQINKLTGFKDFLNMPKEEKEGFHKHQLLQARYISRPQETFIIYPHSIPRQCTFELGDLLGVENGKEVMVRARLNYLKVYPLVAHKLFNGVQVVVDLKL